MRAEEQVMGSPVAEVSRSAAIGADSSTPRAGVIESLEDAWVEFRIAGEAVQFWWGTAGDVGTAAFWVDQASLLPLKNSHRLASSLRHETAVGILGGYGMPAEVGLAAYRRLRDEGLLDPPAPSESIIRGHLGLPLTTDDGRLVRYRFPNQRAARLASALEHLDEVDVLPSDPVQLRDQLTSIPGVGPKTASWVVRNQTGTDRVAILDVHVYRAGKHAGFFPAGWSLPRDYWRLEAAFLSVATLGGVRAANLDSCMWLWMRRFGDLILRKERNTDR